MTSSGKLYQRREEEKWIKRKTRLSFLQYNKPEKSKNRTKEPNRIEWMTVQMLRSYTAVKVTVALVVVPDDIVELSWRSETDDKLWDTMFFGSGLSSLLILRSMKSEIRPGLVIGLESTFISPVSIFTTLDMDGRSFGVSWVQRRPIFKNMQASSASKSPFRDSSTSPTSSFFS